MSIPTSSLGVLPNDLLIPILASLGADSVPSLVNVARTCKQLYALVFNDTDQHIWRELHNRKYDDPRDAAAFPVPRTGYDWRRRVSEREHAVEFLLARPKLFPNDENFWLDVPVWMNPGHAKLVGNKDLKVWFNAAPRIFRAVLSLIDDMPPAPTRSKNAVLVDTLARSTNLATMVTTFGALSDDGQRLWAHLAHYPGFSLPEWGAAAVPSPAQVEEYAASFQRHQHTPTAWERFIEALRWIICAAPPEPEKKELGMRYTGAWGALLASADKSRYFLDDGGAATDTLHALNLDTTACLRSSGLPARPEHDDLYEDSVWDWAGVSGRWCGAVLGMRHYTTSHVLGWEERLVERPGYFDVYAASRAEVEAEMAKFGLDADDDDVFDVKVTQLTKFRSFPPVFFYGNVPQTPDESRVRSPPLFIHGVAGVHLTAAHEPPQISYTFVIRALDPAPSYNFVIEGIQLGWVFKVDAWPAGVALSPPRDKSEWEEDALPPLYERYELFGTTADE